jgi:metal-responsive CopG/Arc/MetJ family transcriptional regulator
MSSTRLTVTLDRELMDQVVHLAEKEDRSKSSTIRVLLREALEERGEDEEKG